jgi:hypothetical protein|tara:strand:+ start:3893 stop:4147 length:255 start_codon:yes stop_codon:yes gene_type:complete
MTAIELTLTNDLISVSIDRQNLVNHLAKIKEEALKIGPNTVRMVDMILQRKMGGMTRIRMQGFRHENVVNDEQMSNLITSALGF